MADKGPIRWEFETKNGRLTLHGYDTDALPVMADISVISAWTEVGDIVIDSIDVSMLPNGELRIPVTLISELISRSKAG